MGEEFGALQCRVARAALKLDVRGFAQLADVSPNTISRLERGEKMQRRTLSYLKGIFEAQGISFVDAGAPSFGGGVGIRLNGERKSLYGRMFEVMAEVPDARSNPTGAFDSIVRSIEMYLDIISDEEREPDDWEKLDLSGAINALSRSDLATAASFLWRGITPPDNQSTEYPRPKAPPLKELGLGGLKQRLAAAKKRGFTNRFATSS
jgi:transcriptional regulator with XRE-family HTH domain